MCIAEDKDNRKKYELIEAPKHIQHLGHKYQIRALKNFNNVNEGDLGGYVNNELALSQDGDCWIYPNAYVGDDVRISEDSAVLPESIIMGNVKINGLSRIRARIYCSGLLELERCEIGYMLYPTEFKCDWSRIKNSTILVRNFNIIRQKSSTSKVGDEGGAPIETIRKYIENQGR